MPTPGAAIHTDHMALATFLCQLHNSSNPEARRASAVSVAEELILAGRAWSDNGGNLPKLEAKRAEIMKRIGAILEPFHADVNIIYEAWTDAHGRHRRARLRVESGSLTCPIPL